MIAGITSRRPRNACCTWKLYSRRLVTLGIRCGLLRGAILNVLLHEFTYAADDVLPGVSRFLELA